LKAIFIKYGLFKPQPAYLVVCSLTEPKKRKMLIIWQ